MKRLVANWTPSVSTDVSSQELVLTVNAEEPVLVVLDPSESSWVSDQIFDEGDSAEVAITVVDAAGNRSDTVVATASLPDVNPAPITGLTLGFEDVA
jgi:hypothetical protein